MLNNLARMIALAEQHFDARTDPRQISFTEEDMEYIQTLHPACMNEISNDQGPICWVTIFPTSMANMQLFLSGKLNENELLRNTSELTPFETIYLCSALTLPEFRNQNITFTTSVAAIEKLLLNHNIQALFTWPFSREGKQLSEKIALHFHLPLHCVAEHP